MQSVREISVDAAKIKTFLNLLTHYFRRKMLHPTASASQRIRSIQIIERIYKIIDLISRNVNARLALESIMLSL